LKKSLAKLHGESEDLKPPPSLNSQLLQKGASLVAKKNVHAFSDISVTMAILADGEDRYEVRIKRNPNKTYFDEYVKLAIGRTSM
jgi:hypothetical protein